MIVEVVFVALFKISIDPVITRVLVFETRKAFLHRVDVLLLALGFLLGLDLFALEVLVIDLPQQLALEERVELKI